MVHECCPRSSHILVDRQAVRHKAERRFVWGEGTTELFTRLNVDIAHLNLGAVPQLHKATALVSVAKHICGSASDLTIRCSVNTLGQHADKLAGMAVALCCHHRCTYDAYLNKEFLASVGIGEKEYQAPRLALTVDVVQLGRDEEEAKERGASAAAAAAAAAEGGEAGSKAAPQPPHGLARLSSAEKEAVGTQCKELLDVGRALYLRDRGFDVRLVRYVAPDISPENTLLLATRGPPPPPPASSPPHPVE
ncbi:tRNA guanosine2'-O-methyltransferase, putative [Acanthamoeba castellanii str. Neff]|uniref:tRNA:m(4)X modification enzyme TRM13 n=1 Tax=Acanthamoeba castellanii (strain ATCC 30010 / Neff) TaxID=1257118 RepID=L8GDA7_ACACF|nr:tRNA guanosine2'-O-methyltransferase, putative [Acanthamoeba castellanii str. Neff]ELR10849.1 tRNA guanosine2'-O-methyltransferase, putative [Acanthamoeba castellanii str. Neff]